MALTFSPVGKPVDPQVVDASTGRMREEWQRYFDQLTSKQNDLEEIAYRDGSMAVFAPLDDSQVIAVTTTDQRVTLPSLPSDAPAIRLVALQPQVTALYVKLGDNSVVGAAANSMRVKPGSLKDPLYIAVGNSETHLSIFSEGGASDVLLTPGRFTNADVTASDIRALGFFDTTNDGTGSGLDADLLDGNEASAFLLTSAIGTTVQAYSSNLDDWSGEAVADYYTAAEVDSGFQPLDSDLTAIAALSTTSFGRALLALADAAALRTAGGLVIGTDVQAYDADTAKLDVAQSWSAAQNFADQLLQRPYLRDYAEVVNALGDLGGGTDGIDLELGNVVSATVSTAEQTFTFSNPPASGRCGSFTLFLTNGGSQTVNWPASVDWAGGSAPSLTASGVDILTFVTIDGGTTWYGFAAGLDMS